MLSEKIRENLTKSSFIRAMFEEGERLRKQFGSDKVYDFSIGNPDIEPPLKVTEALKKAVMDDTPRLHGYMNNAGFADVRAAIAGHIKKNTGTNISFKNIVMTCGAGGALNVVLKTLLNPDEEVIVLSPYFVEYLFYIDNHRGKSVIVKTDPVTFQPDAESIYAAITAKTKAVIINSPHNPTGVIYNEESLRRMARRIEDREKEFGTSICIISDEPYGKVVYDNAYVAPVFGIFKNSIVVDSFSKSLSLPGERIGYIAVNPSATDADMLMDGLIFANRTLGFVNAPALFQRILPESLDATVEVEEYKKRRDLLYNALIEMGYKCIKPQGAFYLFPKSLIEDDAEFCRQAMKYNLIIVPGRGFGCPGYFRISYCVNTDVISNSLPAFKALAKEFGVG